MGSCSAVQAFLVSSRNSAINTMAMKVADKWGDFTDGDGPDPRVNGDELLCLACQAIFHHNSRNYPGGDVPVVHHPSEESFRQAVEGGCWICVQVNSDNVVALVGNVTRKPSSSLFVSTAEGAAS